MKQFVLLVLSVVICLSCKGQINVGNLESKISNIMKANEGIGVSVAVVKDNRICYQKSFGYNPDYKDPNKRISIKSNDVFRIASISKTFVATAIMQLVERGMIDLDEDINKYLKFKVKNPYYPQVPITVRMLLRHRSSISDSQYSKYKNSLVVFKHGKIQDTKTFFLNCRPGTRYNYSNYGYSLLGAIIENVSKTRFDTYIEKNILVPLGIDGSYNVSKIDSSRFVWAYQYDKKKKKFIKSPLMYNPYTKEMKEYVLGESTALFSPAGGMKLSVPDLAKYMIMHINYGSYNGVRILTKESEEELWRVGPKNKYGMGFMHAGFNLKGVDLIGHQGGAYGIHSTMFFSPKDKYGFIVICNGCNSGQVICNQIVRELYNGFVH